MEEDAGELETVRLARELRAGSFSLRKIVAVLESAGKATRRGGKWEAATVVKLLRPRYVEGCEAVSQSLVPDSLVPDSTLQ